MMNHTTFKTGGPADLYLRPGTTDELKDMVQFCIDRQMPWMILGGGANLLVADEGIDGAVIHTVDLAETIIEGETLTVEAGADVSAVVEAAAEQELTGLEFIYAMPGTIGGAVRMNARCYGSSISDVLAWVDYLDEEGNIRRLIPKNGDFAYKVSPFQCGRRIVIKACFRLKKGSRTAIVSAMEKNRADREQKGHFAYPCAGSVFKNNRNFGAPSGQIIDSLGLRGTARGGAQIADFHANIIVNRKNGTSGEILELIELIERQVLEKLNIRLEREVLLVGRWKKP